jgi:spermidine synthase
MVRCSRIAFSLFPGERMPILPMMAVVQAAVSGASLLTGLLYSTACRVAVETNTSTVSRIYKREAIGSCLGGLAAALALAVNLPHFAVLWMLSGLALACVFFFPPFPARGRRMILVIGAVLWILPLIHSGRVEWNLNRLFWRGNNLAACRSGAYGNLAVTRTGDLTSFFENGVLVFTVPDPVSAETKVHFALLEHPAPKRVLLLGGGLDGGIGETLKHPSVQTVDAVELDPELVRLAVRFLPPDEKPWTGNPKVRLVLDDGRRFIRRTGMNYDAILVDMPNPQTVQINRYYTVEFFREVKKRLAPGGILGFSVAVSENVIGPESADLLSLIDATLSNVFGSVAVIPGEPVLFLAGRDGIPVPDAARLIQSMKDRRIENRFVRSANVSYRLSAEKQAYLRSRMHAVPPDWLNRDSRPLGYTDDAVLWAARYSPLLKSALSAARRISFLELTAVATLIIAASWLLSLFKLDGILRLGQGVFIAGFTGMALEILLLFMYQTAYGNLYRDMALIMAGYMAGLAAGSRIEKSFPLGTNRMMVLSQLTLAVLAGLVYPLFLLRIPSSLAGSCFALYAGLCGAAAGIQFISANRLAGAETSPRTAGSLYGLDLAGSALGAVTTAAFLLPILGLVSSLGLLAWMNGLAALGIALPRHRIGGI